VNRWAVNLIGHDVLFVSNSNQWYIYIYNILHLLLLNSWSIIIKDGDSTSKKKHVYYINILIYIYIGVFENVAPHKNMLFDSEHGDGPIDECIQGYLFFRQATRDEGVN
jgi:hypothetical protein